MLGICPNCKIRLDIPPFDNRETNEVILVLSYRKLIDSNASLKSIDDLGYCQVCNARKSDLDNQRKILLNN
ncbi:MAG: hypothetical protein WC979_06675 [Candidatus Pacearchaeota archaeon]|jgi:hypothetical protein